ITLPAELEPVLAELDATGQTALIVAVREPGDLRSEISDLKSQICGVIGVRDAVRSESGRVLDRLRSDGVERFALLTGDREAPARAVADALGGLDELHSELLPADKARWVEEQTKQGRRVAMVGDGVNDAPALATATVGIALGGAGSDIAAEAGDLVLMGDPLQPLPGLVRLSRALVRNIRQNILLFAFGLNGVGVLLSVLGVLSPVAAAVFHEIASLLVMLSALRLLWFERWEQTRLGRASDHLASGAEWLTENLSPARLVYRVLDHRTLLLRLTIAAAVLWWLLGNLVWIRPDEQAIVSRFGRHTATLSPGIYWRWPAPLEEVRRERVDALRTVAIGFRVEKPGFSENRVSG
ncbi:MAG: HAD-IC family P-type ATPase, partial [Planctomycetaceae bacterium]